MNPTNVARNAPTTFPDLTPVRGILLDAVGTLITPHPPVAQVYIAAAARQGIVVDPDAMKSRFAQAFAHDESDNHHNTSEPIEHTRWRRIVAACLPEVPDPNLAFDELWHHFAQPESWTVYDDVPALLCELNNQAFPHVVASNFDARLRDVLHGLQPLRSLADTAVISSEVGFRKPHPDFYAAACRRLDLPPASVLHVGDDPANDLAAPQQSGLQSLLLTRQTPGPPPAISSLGTLTAHLQSLHR